MKAKLTLVALSAALAACGGADTPVDPYADLAEETLLVRFEANPEVAEGQCNPKVHYALRTTEETILLNVNYEVVDQNLNGSGLAIFDEDQSGVARNTADFTMFDPYDMACSELNIRVSDLTCRTEDEDNAAPCPSPQFEGTEMFASFRGLPNY
ncbi:MAG: hypothetical protein NXH72_11025 [Hyphomonadaceae bacterium]|nr:hypothetical protein [Hyphomonadaceae bacterium]